MKNEMVMKVIDLKVAVIREMKDVFSDWNIMAEGDPLCVEEGEFNSNLYFLEYTNLFYGNQIL